MNLNLLAHSVFLFSIKTLLRFYVINLVNYAAGAVINLNGNKLTAFAQGVFKSILDYFLSDDSFATNSISVTKSKFIFPLFISRCAALF